MSDKSWICRALVVAVTCWTLFLLLDGASLRKNGRRKGHLVSDLTGNASMLNKIKLDVKPTLLAEYKKLKNLSQDKTNLTVQSIQKETVVVQNQKDNVPNDNDADNGVDDIENDVAKFNNGHGNRAVKFSNEVDKDKKIEVNMSNEADVNDNNGAGDGLGEAVNNQDNPNNNEYETDLNANQLEKPGDGEIAGKESKRSLWFHGKPSAIERKRANEKQFKELEAAKSGYQSRLHRPTIFPLKLDDIQPPDHVDGLRMEHDGHLNRDYKKEILLGNHEEFEWEVKSKLVSRLKDIFNKADKNHNEFLEFMEIKAWIMLNIQEHLNEAIADNRRIFAHLDSDSNGFVTWKEFYVHFLLAKGYNMQDAEQHSEDYDTISLDPDEKERIIRYKFRWAEADEEPQDNRLTFDELMNFRHPEQSKSMLVRMVRDLIENFDRNDDKLITEEEFAMLPPGEIEEVNMAGNQTWLIERRKEFRDIIDLNRDDVVDEAELKVYVDPHNSNHAKLEAENLIHLADQDSDGRLSLTEVLENAELFLGSKMVDASRNFHDEF